MPRTLTLTAALIAMLAAPVAFAQDIGTVASITPALRGQPPGAAERVLGLGAGVVQDETIITSAAGRAQLLFLDQTSLSVAPNSQIVLDTFVFDPATGGGQMGIGLTTGALRFIGGTLSRDEAAEITTPTATIGIRGSSGLIAIVGGQTYAVFMAGEQMCIETASGVQACTNRPGALLGPNGYEGQATQDFIGQLTSLIDGLPVALRPGQGTTGIEVVVVPGDGPFSSQGELRDEGELDDSFQTDHDFDDEFSVLD